MLKAVAAIAGVILVLCIIVAFRSSTLPNTVSAVNPVTSQPVPDKQPIRYIKPCRIMSSITDKWVVIDAQLIVMARAATRVEAQRIADELNAK